MATKKAAGMIIGLSCLVTILFTSVVTRAKSLEYDCTHWAIMSCGAWDGTQHTMGQFVANYRKNVPGDLQAIYAAYGLDSIDRLQQNYKTGTIDSSGTLRVDGAVVATNVRTLGRGGSPDGYPATEKRIGGKLYYEEAVSDVIKTYSKYGVDAVDAYVLMNGTTPSFVVILACGNPVALAQPTVSCNKLEVWPADNTGAAYNFQTNLTGDSNNANRLVYDFGDGSQQIEQTPTSNRVQYTYQHAGTYLAKVSVYTAANSQAVAATCQHQVTVPQTSRTTTISTSTPPVPSTGAGEILASSLGLTSLVVAGGYYAQSRRAWIKKRSSIHGSRPVDIPLRDAHILK